jgi:hypothetical protein
MLSAGIDKVELSLVLFLIAMGVEDCGNEGTK